MNSNQKEVPSEDRLLRDIVYDQLRGDILSCELPPGAKISEGELAARFEVSKSPVRDALMRLEREALVISLPRQGYRIAPISLSDVQDMFYLRAALERACMERIVRQSSDEQIATLDRFRHFDAQDWEGGFVAYNRAFHCRLAEITTNVRMRDQLCDLIDQMDRAVLISMWGLERKRNEQLAVDDHCRIIDALQKRHVKHAERLVEKHITTARKRLTTTISKMFVAK